jgi:hypothetical protein
MQNNDYVMRPARTAGGVRIDILSINDRELLTSIALDGAVAVVFVTDLCRLLGLTAPAPLDKEANHA